MSGFKLLLKGAKSVPKNEVTSGAKSVGVKLHALLKRLKGHASGGASTLSAGASKLSAGASKKASDMKRLVAALRARLRKAG